MESGNRGRMAFTAHQKDHCCHGDPDSPSCESHSTWIAVLPALPAHSALIHPQQHFPSRSSSVLCTAFATFHFFFFLFNIYSFNLFHMCTHLLREGQQTSWTNQVCVSSMRILRTKLRYVERLPTEPSPWPISTSCRGKLFLPSPHHGFRWSGSPHILYF